jgi:hypothetical protein
LQTLFSQTKPCKQVEQVAGGHDQLEQASPLLAGVKFLVPAFNF